MIHVAERRRSLQVPSLSLAFRVLRNEDLGLLTSLRCFDGVLSNFSGLNCVADPSQVALNLGRLVRPGGSALICISTRVCLWEIAWYAARGNFKKAFRRVRGRTIAQLDGISVPVWYPTIREMRRAFSPSFRLRSIRAVGLFVPPSYVESWARGHQRVLAALEATDRVFAAWPFLRGVGDHVLLEFERTHS
jgi:SAM-dependent methyltransferase